MPDDIAAAARRVAAKLGPHRGKDLTGQCLILDGADAQALLPVLDAVAAGRDDEGRVERMAEALSAAIRAQNPFYASVLHVDRIARAAIAVADAEGAAETAKAPRG